MDPLVKVNVGSGPNDGTGDPLRDAFIKLNKNVDAVVDALGAASGIATLGLDGRLLPAQAPAVQTLPATAHDLNNYQIPGTYRQASTAGAQAGTNYPQAAGGLLEVMGTGASGQALQRYTVASTGSVSPTSGTRQYWRFSINTSWSPWQEVHTAGNSLPYLGRVEAGADLNNYANRGMWAISASSVASGGTNFPVANSGWLVVYCEAAAGATADTTVNQVYIGSDSNRQFFRSLVGGVWSNWGEVADVASTVAVSQLGVAGGVATLDANGRQPVTQTPYSAILPVGVDANTLATPGVWHVNADANATAALNWPVQLAGTLNVEAVAAGNMVTQTYTTRNGTGGVIRQFVRVRFGTGGGTWGTWQEIARVADLPTVAPLHGQCRFVYANTTECRLLPFNGNKVVVNDSMQTIPSGGVAIASTALLGATGSTNYIYLHSNAGTLSLEASLTGHSRHTNGVEIKTGDPSRTLVGVAYNAPGGQFINTAALRGVASWFNRYYPSAQATNFNTGTASASPVQAISTVWVWTWGGENTVSNINGRTYVSTAGASSYTYLYDDGNQSWSAAATSVTANAALPVSLTVAIDDRAEGFHGVSTYLAVAGGGTSNAALTQSIIARP